MFIRAKWEGEGECISITHIPKPFRVNFDVEVRINKVKLLHTLRKIWTWMFSQWNQLQNFLRYRNANNNNNFPQFHELRKNGKIFLSFFNHVHKSYLATGLGEVVRGRWTFYQSCVLHRWTWRRLSSRFSFTLLRQDLAGISMKK